jgi:hypothetical protein
MTFLLPAAACRDQPGSTKKAFFHLRWAVFIWECNGDQDYTAAAAEIEKVRLFSAAWGVA